MPVKLHELLAVRGSVENQLVQTVGKLKETFEKKHQHFGEKKKVFESNQPDVSPETEEQSSLQTTVLDELKWSRKFVESAIDVGFQIDMANMKAVSDIVLEDGTVLAADVPAITLLELAKRLKTVQEFFAAIPTLDPVKGFELDTTFRKPGVYRSREIVRDRTKKIQKPLVLAPATEQHPAQVQLVGDDVVIGRTREVEWSGMITPAEKAGLLERVDEMLRAVKQAQARANASDANTSYKLGRRIMDVILGDVVPAK